MNALCHLISRRAWPLIVVCVGLVGFSSVAHAFVHPGGLHTQADLDRMKARVAAGESPWIESWNALLQNSKAQSTYNPAPQANMGASRQRASADAVAAYFNAIRGYVADSPAHTDNAIRICNLWSAAVNQVPSGTDQPGLSGLYAYQFAVVGEILRVHVGTRWAQADFDRFRNMMTQYLYPICHDFLVTHRGSCITHYWANWDAANIAAIAAIGVLCDDYAMFDEAVDYYKNGPGNGSIQNAVFALHPGGPGQPYGLGQWQETGRDQEHNALGVGLLATFCQIAWNQGVDMFGHDNNRLLAGAEYVAQFNLGQDVPYEFYDNCDDVNQYWPATHDRGRLQRPIWEMLYNHYVIRQGLSAPSLSAMAAVNRPEGFSHDDHFGYGTLAYTLDAAASGYPSAAPAIPIGLTAEDGVGLVSLSWAPVPTANGYVVSRATASGGPYTILSTYRGAYSRYTDTTVVNGTTYYYRVAAQNQTGTGGDSGEASAAPLAASATLANGWALRDIGAVAAAGTADYSTAGGGTLFVSGAGAGIGGTADGGGYAFATVNGDTSITARRIGANGAAGVNGRIGLMIRESLAPDAKAQTLFVGDLGFREARFGTRTTAGGQMSFITGNGYSSNAWFRLVRSGDTFSAYQSGDGVTWHFVGSTVVAMPATAHVGIAAGSGGTNLLRGDFDHVALEGTILPGPPALVAINGHAQVTLNWSPSSGAESYDLLRASAAGGPFTLIASGLTDTSYVDDGLTDGTPYYYVVTARQGTYESLKSNEVSGLPGDITGVWSASPASANWSLGANWFGGQVPGNGDSLAFAASAVTSLTNDLADLTINRLTFNAGAAAFTLAGNPVTLAGDISNQGAAVQTVTFNLALAGTPTINAATGTIALRGVISDAGASQGFIKTGTSALFVTGLNTFSGDVRLTSGSISIAGVGTGSAGAPTAGALGRGTVRLAGGTLTSSAAATIYNTVLAETGTTSALSSAVANITLAGGLAGSGNITESGANVGGTHFNGDNSSFSGTFTSSNATNHRIRFNTAAAGSAAATWVLNNSQTDGNGLNFGTGTIHFGALSGGGQFRNDSALNTTATLSIGALNTNTTFTGVMVANSTRFIAVTKVGTGTLTFTGNHTYNGPTTVTAGALYVNGGFASPVTVTGGTFGGTGSSNAAVTVGAGATLAPGNQAIGTFTTTGALTFNTGATYALQINSTTATADKITAGGATLNNATLSITDLGSGTLPLGTAFTVINNTGAAAVTGTFNGYAEGALFVVGSNTFRFTYQGGTGNDVVLTAVIPPPVITSEATAGGAVGVPFNYTIAATNSPTGFSATGLPSGLGLDVASGVIAGTPMQAGEYEVEVGAINSTASATAPLSLTIARGTAAITIGNLNQIYDGLPKPITATTAPAGLDVAVSYEGSAAIPVNAGSYSVSATVSSPNYIGSATGTLTINKAAATIALSPLQQSYDGTPKTVAATTSPEGLNVELTYDGTTVAPIYPGPHTVVATIAESNYSGAKTDTLVITVTALVRHAPAINSMIDGSAQVLLPENVVLNGGAAIAGDLLVPGTPTLLVNGEPTYAGLKDGPGATTPAGSYTLTLGGDAVVRYLVRRVDAIALPIVEAPPAPVGTRNVTLKNSGQTAGDFATLRNLTLKEGVGLVAVAPGTYGSFNASGSSGFILGVTGATEPSIYNLQNLTLNSGSTLQVAGPVILTLANGASISGAAGDAAHPDDLMLNVASGGITLNAGATLRAIVNAPNGTVILNDGATLVGRVAADRLTLNTNAQLSDAP
jgi:autotransporter-associated beta strand protein